jgi:hypothetical protein
MTAPPQTANTPHAYLLAAREVTLDHQWELEAASGKEGQRDLIQSNHQIDLHSPAAR